MLKMVLALLERTHRSSQKSYVCWCHTRGHRRGELAADVRDRGVSGNNLLGSGPRVFYCVSCSGSLPYKSWLISHLLQ
jgi:hypothetical protein